MSKWLLLIALFTTLLFSCSSREDFSNLPDDQKVKKAAEEELQAEKVDITKTDSKIVVFIATKPITTVAFGSDAWQNMFDRIKDFENRLIESKFNTQADITVAFQYKSTDGDNYTPVKFYIKELKKIENTWDVYKYVDIEIKNLQLKNWYCDYAHQFKLDISDEKLYNHCTIRFKCKELQEKGFPPIECKPYIID